MAVERGVPTQRITQRVVQAAIEAQQSPELSAGRSAQRIWVGALVALSVAVGCAIAGGALGWPLWAGPLVGLVAGLAILWRCRAAVERIQDQEGLRAEVIAGLEGGLTATAPRLPALHPEAAALNSALATIHEQIVEARTRRVLLETVLDAAPFAVVVCDYQGVVVISNRTANDLLFQGRALMGEDFDEVLANSPEDMARAVRNQADELFTVDQGDEEQSYLVSTPFFDLNQHRYTVYLIKQLTRELNRQEVAIWKKMIRVISHELNNSLAPVSSLIHSARLVLDKPAHADKLVRIFDIIEDRTRHLLTFLEGYARFARLAPPDRQPVEWAPFLRRVCELQGCALIGTPPEAPGWVDAAQMEQALINLIKNASEAEGPSEEVAVQIEAMPEGGIRLSVLDRGRGMSDDTLRQALLPFYSTKKRGSGLGLSLCREIVDAHEGALRIERREGGGTAARIWLPDQG